MTISHDDMLRTLRALQADMERAQALVADVRASSAVLEGCVKDVSRLVELWASRARKQYNNDVSRTLHECARELDSVLSAAFDGGKSS